MNIATLRRTADDAAEGPAQQEAVVAFRSPSLKDGPEIHALVAACPPLDVNSPYCNLLQCGHFADTCIVAEQDGAIAGWISGYRLPGDPAVLFIWQVAVSPRARGRRLAGRMLDSLLARPHLAGVRWLHTTITEDNGPSWALFTRFAKSREAPLKSEAWLLAGKHFSDGHDGESLVTIGPFDAAQRL